MTDPKAKDMTNNKLADELHYISLHSPKMTDAYLDLVGEAAARLRAVDWRTIDSAPPTWTTEQIIPGLRFHKGKLQQKWSIMEFGHLSGDCCDSSTEWRDVPGHDGLTPPPE